jgi:hypothetical protein
VIGAIDEHNRFDIELCDFAKKLFEEGLRRNADAISARLATLNSGEDLDLSRSLGFLSKGPGDFC